MSPTAGVAVVSALFVTSGLLSPFLDPGSLEARRGADLYRDEDWVGAAEHFRRAENAAPDPALRFNLGAAAYQGQNFPEALEAFGAAAPTEGVSANRIAYNLGNAFYRTGNLEGALEAYRRALRENPDDEDARYNYEFVLRQMQSQSSDENQDQQSQENQDGDSSENQNSESSPPDSTGESQSGSEQQEQQQPSEAESQPQDQEQQQRQAQGEENQKQDDAQEANGAQAQEGQEQFLQPEDALRLLDAVTPEERELIRARFRSSERKRVEKDW